MRVPPPSFSLTSFHTFPRINKEEETKRRKRKKGKGAVGVAMAGNPAWLRRTVWKEGVPGCVGLCKWPRTKDGDTGYIYAHASYGTDYMFTLYVVTIRCSVRGKPFRDGMRAVVLLGE